MLVFNSEDFLAPHPTSKLEDHPLTAVPDCWISILFMFSAYTEWEYIKLLKPGSYLINTRFNIKKFCIVLTLHLCALCGSQNELCFIQHWLVFYNRDGEWWLNGMHRIFIQNRWHFLFRWLWQFQICNIYLHFLIITI